MNILITGAKGQLGSEIKEASKNYSSFNFFFEDSKSLDITDSDFLKNYIKKNKIESVINCAAYTAVDQAELDKDKAHDVNTKGVYYLGIEMEKVGGKIIHISTDYVFNGRGFEPYKEGDKVDPIGVYGKTKFEGEKKLLDLEVEAIIIRTSWVYSSYGKNFVKTMLRLGEEKEELNVIYDQIGSPTYAKDLAIVCLEILKNEIKINSKGSVYHYSNEGVTSWYDFSKAIMEIADLKCNVFPIETKDYPTPAKRPNYSVMNKKKIKKDFNISIPYWRDSLKEGIEKIKKNKNLS
ncbi:dTDP-4-dehydrorhamnose reductase [Tenacibaculum aiptasiae]|uniref:dTDP-4-dehydrorhamnose reductase n=1 Tax=Tenacibaculum aiptasiae TaxID=426481 RepID=UPI00232BB3D6|nr:dTDP-4-dehydrorhamnose reductase [Tenacibaculum aiptasiae]